MVDTTKPGRVATLLFAALTLLSVGMLAYPMIVIQPFRHQGEVELKVALWLFRWRIYFEAAVVVFALGVLAWYWQRQHRAWLRLAACAAALLICGAAGLSRVNIFEIMFHRYDRPAFEAASASKLDGDEKVIAIVLGGQARAYPIRSMSYHHIVNDEVGGIPVVATY